MNKNPITISTTIHAPVSRVWDCWGKPQHIVNWAFATGDWEAPFAENDLRTGGNFKTVMAARDKSHSFDFSGQYTAVEEHAVIEYDLDDGRHVKIVFEQTPEGCKVTQTFDPEQENSCELQKNGWQAILDNFKKYVERNSLA